MKQVIKSITVVTGYDTVKYKVKSNSIDSIVDVSLEYENSFVPRYMCFDAYGIQLFEIINCNTIIEYMKYDLDGKPIC